MNVSAALTVTSLVSTTTGFVVATLVERYVYNQRVCVGEVGESLGQAGGDRGHLLREGWIFTVVGLLGEATHAGDAQIADASLVSSKASPDDVAAAGRLIGAAQQLVADGRAVVEEPAVAKRAARVDVVLRGCVLGSEPGS